MVTEYLLQGKVAARGEQVSVALMVVGAQAPAAPAPPGLTPRRAAGAMIASAADIGYSGIGYAFVAMNCVSTSAYLVCVSRRSRRAPCAALTAALPRAALPGRLINKASSELGVDNFSLLYHNNVLCIVPMALLALVSGDLTGAAAFPHLSDAGFLVCLALSSSLAIVLNYTIFLCTTLNSALTTSITGPMRAAAGPSAPALPRADAARRRARRRGQEHRADRRGRRDLRRRQAAHRYHRPGPRRRQLG